MKNYMVTMILVLILVVLQWLIWVPGGPQAKLTAQNKTKQAHQEHNQALAERNAAIQKDVENFRSNPNAIEAKARRNLGMIRNDEVFLLVPSEDGTTEDDIADEQ